MTASSEGSLEIQRPGEKRAWLDALARRLVLSRLGKLRHGQVIVRENDRQFVYGRPTDEFQQAIQIDIKDGRFYRDVAFGGGIGAGEAYMHGEWSCDDLSGFLRVMLQNRKVLEEVDSGTALISKPLQKLLHYFNKNTRKGSKRNIAAHYDLGNDFYSLWLDQKMMYSCAWFDSAESTLNDASTAKLDRICRKLNLSAADSVVEIGTGWGGFAIHAASHYGCHVTTTTISKEQYEYAKARVAEAGLEDRVTLLFDDYRDLQGSYDKLVSIEMIEAVGHQFHATFFKKCCDLLKPNGRMLLQAITITDQRYDQYKNNVDFINKYIFPGGCLTSVTDMTRTMTTGTDMRVIHLEDIGPHYARTLRHWHDRFFDSIATIRKQGYSEEFIRMWQFYLCYCESAFVERAIGLVQVHIVRPDAR